MNLHLYQELLSKGQYSGALKLCDEALHGDPSNSNLWHLKGFAHRMLGDYRAATLAQERSLALSPKQIPVLMALAISRQLSGDFEGALADLRNVQAIDPYYHGAYNSAALTREKMGDMVKAAELYEAAMQVLVEAIVMGLDSKRENSYVDSSALVGAEWLAFVSKATVKLAARADIGAIVLPTPDMADCPVIASSHGGSYWFDHVRGGKTDRVLLPNFFQTICQRLKGIPEYAVYARNLSNLLTRVGDEEGSAKWLSESMAFSRN